MRKRGSPKGNPPMDRTHTPTRFSLNIFATPSSSSDLLHAVNKIAKTIPKPTCKMRGFLSRDDLFLSRKHHHPLLAMGVRGREWLRALFRRRNRRNRSRRL